MAAKSAKEHRELYASLLKQAQEYEEEHSDDDGLLAADHAEKYDKLFNAARDHAQAAERIERRTEAESGLSDPAGDPLPKPQPRSRFDDPGNPKPTVLMRSGYGPDHRPAYKEVPSDSRYATAEYRERLNDWFVNGKGSQHYAALQSDNDTQAGYLLASEQLAAGILQAVDDMLFVRRYARVHTVREAHSLGIRKRTTRLSTFAYSTELANPPRDTSLDFGKKVLTPHHLTGAILLSRDLLRRNTVGIEEYVRMELARDAGEVMEDAFFTGTGAGEPLGVFTASSDGVSTSQDVSTGNTTSAITADGLREAKYSLKAQYREGGVRGSTRWLFHRTAVKQISKLKDGEGQYLWRPGITEGDPDRLLGFPVDESERSPSTFTSGLYVGILCNWNYYEIADALDMEFQRLEELNARTNQVEIIGRLKNDAMPTLEEAFVRVTLA